MRVGKLVVVAVALAVAFAKYAQGQASGSNVILLMHGFAGWGPEDDLYDVLEYFGFLEGSVSQHLESLGYTVIVTTVGPVSSVWDRVCEAFAEVKGLQTDYGGAHSAFYSHTRLPSSRNYSGQGLYPNWGTNNCNGICKIHIITHSMGGQDAHVLSSLLAYGNAAEIQDAQASNYDVSALFAGGNANWIASVSTISAPHDGTTLAPYLVDNIPFLKDFVLDIVDLIDTALPATTNIYNFRLDQWGISPQQNGESFDDYLTRITSSSLFQDTNDISIFDLSPLGARTINENYPLASTIPYFSYASLGTSKALLGNTQVPDITTLVFMWPTETILGSYTASSPVRIDSSWWPNDGVVNSNSMQGPTLGASSSNVVAYDGNAYYGKFSFVSTYSGYDHLGIAQMVTSLPATNSSTANLTSVAISVGANSSQQYSAPDNATISCAQMEAGYNLTCGNPAVSQDSCTAIQAQIAACNAASTLSPTASSTKGPMATNSADSARVAIIAGSTVGGVAAIAIVALALAFIVRHNRLHAAPSAKRQPPHEVYSLDI